MRFKLYNDNSGGYLTWRSTKTGAIRAAEKLSSEYEIPVRITKAFPEGLPGHPEPIEVPVETVCCSVRYLQ